MTRARVCVRIVSKAIRFVPAVAPNPDRELGEARAAIDRGDSLAALKRLDHARRGYHKQRDSDGLDHVLHMAELVDTADDRARVGRENLAYAVKQNLRQESRRQAQERKETWADPYPDLQAPTEHTGLVLTRGVKVAVGIGVLLGTALLLAVFIVPWFFESDTKTVSLRLLNDTPQTVTVRGCFGRACDETWLDRDLEPGQETETDVAPEDFVDLFHVSSAGRDDVCLPVRVHDGYRAAGWRRHPRRANLEGNAVSRDDGAARARRGNGDLSSELGGQGGEVARRPRAYPDQRVVERVHESGAIAVGKRLHERLANRFLRPASRRLSARQGS